jgi:putative iron-dependent peroxidase
LSVPGIASIAHDVWVWMHGTGDDGLLDAARAVCRLLDPVATLASEVHGFVYRDSRDLTGFIDGTENPPVEEAYRVALVSDGQPGAGGSHALVQRWVHALDRFEALAVEEQEQVIGRTKADSIELDEEAKPATAHIARVVIEDDRGQELEIYRRSVPYGTTAEHGLMFVAFAADPTRMVRMLERMFGASADGIRDRLTAFSTPVTGATYFVPSLEALGAALG